MARQTPPGARSRRERAVRSSTLPGRLHRWMVIHGPQGPGQNPAYRSTPRHRPTRLEASLLMHQLCRDLLLRFTQRCLLHDNQHNTVRNPRNFAREVMEICGVTAADVVSTLLGSSTRDWSSHRDDDHDNIFGITADGTDAENEMLVARPKTISELANSSGWRPALVRSHEIDKLGADSTAPVPASMSVDLELRHPRWAWCRVTASGGSSNQGANVWTASTCT